jgi:hypothetical protein
MGTRYFALMLGIMYVPPIQPNQYESTYIVGISEDTSEDGNGAEGAPEIHIGGHQSDICHLKLLTFVS